jgi:hypothetical protein
MPSRGTSGHQRRGRARGLETQPARTPDSEDELQWCVVRLACTRLWCDPPHPLGWEIILCSCFPLYSLGISYFLPSVSFLPVLILPLMCNYTPRSSANPSLPPRTCHLRRKRCSTRVSCLTRRSRPLRGIQPRRLPAWFPIQLSLQAQSV